MKRPIHAAVTGFILTLTLLSSACAPAPYMVATLTQLPFAGTPATSTPYPTRTPSATRTVTPTPAPTIVDATSIGPTSSPASDESPPDVSVLITTTPVVCPPFDFDTTVPSPNTPEQFIGRHYDLVHRPPEIQGYSAGMLDSDTYSWARVNVQGRDVYWIEKLVCRNASEVAYWEIVDALALPPLSVDSNEVAVDLCFQGDQQIPFVVAYGTYDPSKPAAPVVNHFVGWPIQVKQAWAMKEKFIPLDLQGLTCMLQEPQSTN